MPNQTPAQKLQECRDKLDQATNELDRTEGMKEELETLREKLARATLKLEQDTSVSNDERRRFTEQIAEAVSQRDTWTRRAIKSENELLNYKSVINELKAYIASKECVLPQIKRILGGAT